ncbi:MAG: RluA family pseudouridine synthase [Planctomycetota bacterium]|nr:RluA family pseudouridine synthase [Planctomycetota bacterium]
MPDPTSRRLTVSPHQSGGRLDAFLADHLALSREQVRQLLARSLVFLDGRPVPPRGGGERLVAGSTLVVEPFLTAADAAVVPQPELPLITLAAGPGWVIVDKPAGLPVHPLEPDERGTVLNALAARHPEIQGVGEAGLRSGVVHRLDVETSGCLAFALDAATWQTLRDAFRLHHSRKVYRALVRGPMTGRGRETLDLIVARHRPAKVRVVVSDPSRGKPGPAKPTRGGKPAKPDKSDPASQARRCDLTWHALETFPATQADPGATLLEIELGTGFLHQIRVMLAHLGHPVLGDTLYGDPALSSTRPMLHAASLAVGPATAASPDPADFAASLAQLRSHPH